MDLNIYDFKNKVLAKAIEEGFTEAEVFYQQQESTSVDIYKGEVEKFQNSNLGGVGFRGIYNGVMGYYYSEFIDESIVDEIIDGAKQNSEIINDEDKEIIFGGSKEYADVRVYNEENNKISLEQRIEAARLMEKTAYEYSKLVKGVTASTIVCDEENIAITNTKGVDIEEKSNCLLAYISVMVEKDGQTKEGGEIEIIRGWEEFSPQEVAIRATKKALDSLGAESIASGNMSVIFKNEAFADLLNCFKSNFYAENVQKGFSLLKDRLGEKIASDLVTLLDEPLLENGLASTAFDSEGVATYNKTLIKNGELKTYLYNLKSANKDGVESTGNGFKASYKGFVGTRATNFYIENGNMAVDEMCAEVKNGVYITELGGLHAGTNAVTGDFSLAAEGFVIENGEITKPVEQITVAGNFYGILKSISAVADDLYFSTSAVGSPSVRVDDIAIAGK